MIIGIVGVKSEIGATGAAIVGLDVSGRSLEVKKVGKDFRCWLEWRGVFSRSALLPLGRHRRVRCAWEESASSSSFFLEIPWD